MKKASKYDNMFDKMREVLIEYATAKDEQGRWLHKTPEIMRKFGFGDDPKVIDGFNRWLNRKDIYRCPKPKRSERLHIEVETVDTLSPALQSLQDAALELFPSDTPERDPVTAALADTGRLNEIARAMNKVSEAMQTIAYMCGLHIMVETVHTTSTGAE